MQQSQFVVSALPGNLTAGNSATITFTAEDAFGNPVIGYSGPVSLASSDTSATFGGPTFSSGVGSVSVSLFTAGSQSVTVGDQAQPSIQGTSNAISVSAAAATHFNVSVSPSTTTAGTSATVSFTAVDAFGNSASRLHGHGRAQRHGFASHPGCAPSLSAGVGTASVEFETAGLQTVQIADSTNSSIAGTSNTP